MVRGDPVCRKEDCSQYDIGLVFKEISSYSDQDKVKFLENVWKPGELFDFPVSVECSNSNRHFVWSWLKRFPWLAYSKYLDGAFCLPCVFFGVQCGRNSNKLDKLYKSPLTLWTSAMSRFTKHASGKFEMHNFAVIAMENFLRNMTRESVPIDQQINNLLQQQIKRNREIFVLVNVCRTRRIERIDGMDRIVELLHPVVATLEDISMNRNAPSNGNWNQNSRNDAQALINAITFSFIVTLVIVRHILDLTRPLTVRLQKKAMDLLKAKEEIVLLKAALRGMQMDLNTRHHALYEEAVALARHVSVQPSMPRIIQRQVHRNNAPAPTPEDYYRINLTTDFLNHALVQLDSRFEDDVFECYKGFSVIPSILLATNPVWKDNVWEFCNHYRQDIPNYAGLPAELLLWERMWKGKKDRREDIPDSIDATLEQIDKDAYVNIYTILQILITIPISSASCERSISTLRNLKTYLRNTMAQDRLNGLALMHAHRDMELDLEKVIDLFANLHPRRMRMENILNE